MVRWNSYVDYLGVEKFDKVFLTDAFDVLIPNDPFSFLDWENYDLFVGNEEGFVDWDYMQAVWKLAYNVDVPTKIRNSTLMNCGIIGGTGQRVGELLSNMTTNISKYKKPSCDMVAFNEAMHFQMTRQNRIFRGGTPLNSVFKNLETSRTDVAFIHK